MSCNLISEAIGVVTNKTYNVYIIETCLTIPIEIQHLTKREAVISKNKN
jgi:hypothetical protein